jgi:hypothetical protein
VDSIVANPEMGEPLFKVGDPKWRGFTKYALNINGTEYHYVYKTGFGVDDVKIIIPKKK